MLQRLYLTRVPLGLGITLAGYPFFATLALPAMFRSTLILTANGITIVTAFAIIAALTVMATRRTVLFCGRARFGIAWRQPAPAGAATILGYLAFALPLVATIVRLSAAEGLLGLPLAIAHALLGAFCAGLFMLFVTFVHALLVDAADDLPDIVVPTDNRVVKAVHAVRLSERAGWTTRLIARLQPILGPGYLAAGGRIHPAHLYATGLSLVYVAVYTAGYVAWTPGSERGAGVPALAYLLVIATMATWVLAGVAFFLDRHRLPTLLPIVLFSLGVWTISRSDHYFPLRDASAVAAAPVLPAEIAATRRHPLLAVVAIDGGGIHAAAWGAEVLTRVAEQWPQFQGSVRFISAVSGGSVGTMHYLAALKDGAPEAGAMGAVRDRVQRGSLNETAWGLAYPDLWRVFLPVPAAFRFQTDRAWAMEQAWRRDWPGPIPTLAEWRLGVREGWRPAIAFNATVLETGRRFAFTTFAAPPAWHLDTFGQDEDNYRGHDIDVPTAVRVSAAFPYVTPIARAAPESRHPVSEKHLADGGYYDNSGMGLAMRWLDAAIADSPEAYHGTSVAFIQVRSSPTPTPAELARLPKDRGWLYQVIGPIQTLLNVRVTGQRERAEIELELLARSWQLRGVTIRRFEFAFEAASPPLSWQLSDQEIRNLTTAWESKANRTTIEALVELGRQARWKDPRPPGSR